MLAKTLIPAVVLGSIALVPATASRPADEISSVVLQDPVARQQSELIITMSNRGTQPKIGLPDFIASGGSAALQAAAKTMADVLSYDLGFEREFVVVSRTASASIPAATTPETLPFQRWAEIGADYVLLGTLREAGDRMPVDVRLVSVRGPNVGQSAGFTYDGCAVANPRYCAHFISDDIHDKVRGVQGVARTRLAFTSDRDATQMPGRVQGTGNQGKELYLSDYDGANQLRLTVNRNLNITPKWGPDPRTLAYTSYVSGYQDVYVTILDGRPPSRPASGDSDIHNMLPAISPDGTKIAYASTRGGSGGHWDIWVVDRDGRNQRNLTPNTPSSTESAPTWSPSGLQIAFTSDRTGSNQIYIINNDGTGLEKITSESRTDRPSWSSLNYIAYTTERPAGQDIMIYDIPTRTSKILTDGRGSNASPTVAPNGRHVAFVTSRFGREQIAIVDYPDPGTPRQVTGTGTNTYPSWSPSPKAPGAK
jgi:TolB protein